MQKELNSKCLIYISIIIMLSVCMSWQIDVDSHMPTHCVPYAYTIDSFTTQNAQNNIKTENSMNEMHIKLRYKSAVILKQITTGAIKRKYPKRRACTSQHTAMIHRNTVKK